MKNKWVKYKKFFDLFVKNIEVKIYFYVSVLLFSILCTSLVTQAKDLIINLIASFISLLVLLLAETLRKFNRFMKLEGTYNGVLYDLKNKKILKTDNVIGEYVLQYEGGYMISIKKVKCLENNWENLLWEGEAEISDSNIGTLYWRYSSPEEFKDNVGYKKIIIPKNKDNIIKIYLFDKSSLEGHREVLIKQPTPNEQQIQPSSRK
ncbi:MAG: hypothetical protein WCY00_02450 [Candidatus Dojkabacteria bacterium]